MDPVLELVKQRLIREEGLKYEVYLDHKGYPTGGIGHLLPDSYKQRVGEKLTKKQVDQWFIMDVQTALKDAKIFANVGWDRLTEQRQAVLIEMAFQLGGTRLKGFKKLRALINSLPVRPTQKELEACAAEMRDSNWWKVDTRTRAEELCVMFVQNIQILN